MAVVFDEETGVYSMSLTEIDDWLASQPQNTKETPYKMNIISMRCYSAAPLMNYIKSTAARAKYIDLSFTTMMDDCGNDIDSCFSGCTTLVKSPVIMLNATNMVSCFHGCSSLVVAPNIPNGVRMMSNCFEDCTSLTTVPVIPYGVSSLAFCFRNCSSLQEITSWNCDLSEIQDNESKKGIFKGCSSLERIGQCDFNNVDNFSFVKVASARNFYGDSVFAFSVNDENLPENCCDSVIFSGEIQSLAIGNVTNSKSQEAQTRRLPFSTKGKDKLIVEGKEETFVPNLHIPLKKPDNASDGAIWIS